MSRGKTKTAQAPPAMTGNGLIEPPRSSTILRDRYRGADGITFRHVGGTAVRFERGGKGHVAVKVGGETAFLDCDEVMTLIEFLAGPAEGWR